MSLDPSIPCLLVLAYRHKIGEQIYSSVYNKDRETRNSQEHRKLRPGEVVEEKKVKINKITSECCPWKRVKDLNFSVNGILICIAVSYTVIKAIQYWIITFNFIVFGHSMFYFGFFLICNLYFFSRSFIVSKLSGSFLSLSFLTKTNFYFILFSSFLKLSFQPVNPLSSVFCFFNVIIITFWT